MGQTSLMGWVIAAVIAILSIILLAGKGSFLIAGYNNASKEKKARFYEKRLGRVLGGGLFIIAVIMGISNYYKFNYTNAILKYIYPWGIIAVIAAMIVLINTVCKKK